MSASVEYQTIGAIGAETPLSPGEQDLPLSRQLEAISYSVAVLSSAPNPAAGSRAPILSYRLSERARLHVYPYGCVRRDAAGMPIGGGKELAVCEYVEAAGSGADTLQPDGRIARTLYALTYDPRTAAMRLEVSHAASGGSLTSATGLTEAPDTPAARTDAARLQIYLQTAAAAARARLSQTERVAAPQQNQAARVIGGRAVLGAFAPRLRY